MKTASTAARATHWLNRCHFGDRIETMRGMPAGIVQTCVTSPPYFGLRDYGHAGQIGLEETPAEFVAKLVEVFREVRRLMRDDGTLWLNLGDSYAGGGCGARDEDRWPKQSRNDNMPVHAKTKTGLKAKDLIGIPWRVAFALQDDGWYLRQDIVWSKPNPMPESVDDRCTKAHEYIFLLSKSASYYCDMKAIEEPAVSSLADIRRARILGRGEQAASGAYLGSPQRDKSGGFPVRDVEHPTRNRRSVWTVPTAPYKGAHFATFPPALIEPCILAGAPAGGVVLDPFFGSGTTGQVSQQLGRDFIGIELNEANEPLQRERLRQPGLVLGER
ncbi:DNA-methyltransferase [Variovorax gossypii]